MQAPLYDSEDLLTLALYDSTQFPIYQVRQSRILIKSKVCLNISIDYTVPLCYSALLQLLNSYDNLNLITSFKLLLHRAFIQGQRLGKVTSCEGNFAWLVSPSKGDFMLQSYKEVSSKHFTHPVKTSLPSC